MVVKDRIILHKAFEAVVFEKEKPLLYVRNSFNAFCTICLPVVQVPAGYTDSNATCLRISTYYTHRGFKQLLLLQYIAIRY